MGSLGSKNKNKKDEKTEKRKKKKKNNPRNAGSTQSLTTDFESNLTNVSALQNPYTKEQTNQRQPKNSGESSTLPRAPLLPPKPNMKPSLSIVRAMYDYTKRYDDDLEFLKGDKMEIIQKANNDEWWLARNIVTKEKGFIPSNYVVLDDNSIESQDWWFGKADRSEATKQLLLPGNPIGTFLIRNSKEKNNFALSVLDKDEKNELLIRHYLIRKMDNGGCYIRTTNAFTDIIQLINFYKVESAGLKCRLTTPCPKEMLALPFKQLEVERKDIKLGEKLGSGNFGDVHAGMFRQVVDVAVKSLKPGSMSAKAFLDEAEIMHKLRHPKLVLLMGVCTVDEPIYIITERMINGALIDYLKKDMGTKIKFPLMTDMASQIAYGMSYLETKNFIHRDLRAANILVGENNVVKVADFGLARILNDIYEGDDDVYKGNPQTKFPIKWTAPEAAKEFMFSVKSDVWSYGILLYELVTYGRIPYPGMDNTSTLEFVAKGGRMSQPSGENVVCSDEIYDIMLNCWNAKPELRPTFEHLKNVFEDFVISTEGSYSQDI